MSEHVRDDETVEQKLGAETQSVGKANDDLVGRTIDGKYRVEALIGAGGMGKVYRGRNTRTDSPVAIKTLIPDLLVDDSLVKRFEIEAKAASNLRHPNTIRIYDFGHEGDVLFMVMELLDGMSLEGLLATETIVAPGRLINIVRQVCRSLDEAHTAGLVHRDIKPDNIFLNRVGNDDEHVKVLDFGVAKLQNKQYGNATLTQAGMIFGTPRYMSPEQARAFELDGRSDIYALGVIMYEALTGKPPFVANDAVGVLIKHVNEPPLPFRQMNPDTPEMPELEAVVMRCLAKDPDDRFDDVRNLVNALDGVAPLYGARTTGAELTASDRSPATTVAFNSGPHTPQKIRSEAFETLGVSSGRYESGPQVSRYTMGADRTDVPSGDHTSPGRSSVAMIAGVLGIVVVLAGVALFALVGGGDDPAPPAADGGTAPAADAAGANAPFAGTPAGPMVELAQLRVAAAASDASERALARVVPMELRASPEGTAAFARIEGADGEPVALPHTFVFTRDPNSPPATVKFIVTAEGFRDASHEAPLARSEVPIVVALRRPSSNGGSSDQGSARVPPPPPRDAGGNGGFEDPYRNRP